jgi:hypothetical protein
MPTVIHLPATRRPPIGPNQLSALMRWHGAKSQLAVLTTLREQPHFPLIDTGGTPAPPRKSRRNPRGGGSHAA